MKILKQLSDAGFTRAQLVGSRVTCDPAPTDTDQDVLVLLDKGGVNEFARWADEEGYELDGSEVEDYFELSPFDTFQSFSRDTVNLIATEDAAFYRKFMAATGVAKRLNLLNKADRIALFQAVLYGNAPADFAPAFNAPESDFL